MDLCVTDDQTPHESIMDETHGQETADVATGVHTAIPVVGPRLTTIRTPRRHAPTTLIASLGILTAMTLGIVSTATTNWSRAQPPSAPSADSAARSEDTAGGSVARVREGTRLAGRLGQFTQLGDRLSFSPERSSTQLVVLENLVLDRVSHILTDTSDALTWSVSGRVTEFRGANFVFLERAVVKRRGVSTEQSGEPRR
jgi:hypothetical protein